MAWRERGQKDYLSHLDEAVRVGYSLGFVLIIDWPIYLG